MRRWNSEQRNSKTVKQSVNVTVLDPGSWDRAVVFVGTGCLGNLRRDTGNLEWGGVEERVVSLQVTWDQGGRDPITPRRVSK